MLRSGMHIIGSILFSASVLLSPALVEKAKAEAPAAFVSCECEQSACGPCETEVGTSFYSAKCGPNDSKVKSCKKPTCVAVENQPLCLAELAAKKGEALALQAAPPKPEAPQAEAPRAPASVEKTAGEIVQIEGAAVVRHARGGVENAKVKMSVFEGDLVETKADGKVKIRLRDGADESASSELIAVANTRVRVEVAKFKPEKNARQVMLNLLSGKIRSRVHQKYDTPENTYQVKTKTAVAGVRGTDFVASFEPGQNEWKSEIRTLEGRVALHGGKGEEGSKQLEVPAGTYASFVITAPPPAADEAEIVAAIASSGEMTPLFKMTEDESKGLDEATEFKAAQSATKITDRNVASAANDGGVCSEPRGEYNQCSWTCEGNPAGEKRCRTDLQNVKCVRRLCRANGLWAEPKRLPASQSDLCEPARPVVRDCGSYW